MIWLKQGQLRLTDKNGCWRCDLKYLKSKTKGGCWRESLVEIEDRETMLNKVISWNQRQREGVEHWTESLVERSGSYKSAGCFCHSEIYPLLSCNESKTLVPFKFSRLVSLNLLRRHFLEIYPPLSCNESKTLVPFKSRLCRQSGHIEF